MRVPSFPGTEQLEVHTGAIPWVRVRGHRRTPQERVRPQQDQSLRKASELRRRRKAMTMEYIVKRFYREGKQPQRAARDH